MDRWQKFRRPLTFLGSFVFTLPLGLPLYVGNLAVYCLSYITTTTGVDNPSLGPWVLSIFNMAKALGTTISGILPKYIGDLPTLIFSSFIFSSGFFLCYFAVQKSFVLLMLTLAFLPGVSSGMSRLMTLRILISWSKGNMGILSSIVPTSFGIGAIMMNQFVTWYVNPTNQIANRSIDTSEYFDQPEILERVPVVFLWLGGLSLVVMVTGSLMISKQEYKDDKEKEYEESQRFLSSHDSKNETKSISKNDDLNSVDISEDEEEKDEEGQKERLLESSTHGNIPPKNMVKGFLFYVIVFIFVSGKQGEMVFYTYYKSYGQLSIKDDHFLTNIGTAISFIAVLTCPLCGVAIDRIGIKSVTIFLYSLCGCLFYWIYHSVFLDKWVYFIVCAVLSAGQNSYSVIYPVLLSEYFGKLHFASNYSVFLTIGSILNLATPFVIDFILQQYGWFQVFTYVGVLATGSTVCSIFFVPRKR